MAKAFITEWFLGVATCPRSSLTANGTAAPPPFPLAALCERSLPRAVRGNIAVFNQDSQKMTISHPSSDERKPGGVEILTVSVWHRRVTEKGAGPKNGGAGMGIHRNRGWAGLLVGAVLAASPVFAFTE